MWLLLVGGLIAAYGSNLYEMWHRWFPSWKREGLGLWAKLVEGESYYTHGPLVPVVSLVIAVLLIRHTKIEVRPSRWLGGIVLVGSLLVHLASSFARVNFVSLFTIIGVVAGLVLYFWGRRALARLWFPIAFLVFMVPLPEVSIAQMNFRLKMFASDWGVRLANTIGIVAERSGNKVFLTGDKQLVIANVCNGLRTIISLLAFGALYAYVCKLRGLWRVGLFIMSVPVAVVSNSVRVVALIVIAEIWDVATATGFFHDISGLMIYVVAFALMFGLEQLVLGVRQLVGRPARIRPLFEGAKRADDDPDPWEAMATAVSGKAGWTAVILVLVTCTGAFWLNRSVPPVWSGQVAGKALPEELTVDGKPLQSYNLELDDLTLTILETRDYLYRRYVRPGVTPVDFCIIFSQDNRKGTHPPDLCLEGGGQDIVATGGVVVPNVEGIGDLPCRELVVQSGAERLYFLYTYRCGETYTDSFWEQQLRIFANGLLNRDASGALIRVSTVVGTDVDDARHRTAKLLSAALPHVAKALR